jgi:hypothetical protein
MDSLRRENEDVPAVGNHRVNARGDRINRGAVTKTAEQIARENHRVQSAVIKTGLKGPVPELADTRPAPVKAAKPAKTKEVELPSGDIVIEKDSNED